MTEATKRRLWIRGACQVVQVVSDGRRIVKGPEAMQHVACIEQRMGLDGSSWDGVGVVIDRKGEIEEIGYDSEITQRYEAEGFERIVDAGGQCILPGLVDAHTHPVWAGDRVHEFSLKLAGASYMEIHQAGGGIYFTVDRTRAASANDLYNALQHRLSMMLRSGSTLVEAKSGYGLDVENEIKMLEVLLRARREGPMELSITYCGAHAVPRGLDSEQATTDIIDVHLPQLKSLMDQGQLEVDNIDVFCETKVFSVDQTRRILAKGCEMGLAGNFHAEELSYLGGVEMGVEMGVSGVCHVEHISPQAIDELAASARVVAVLLPTTAFLMRLTPPPVRQMIQAGVAVALGTDFNPNAHCTSMAVVMHLAAVTFHMSLPETLIAATINAAASLNKAHSHGSIEKGKQGDLIVISAPRWEHLIYQLANPDLISVVVKRGKVVHENPHP